MESGTAYECVVFPVAGTPFYTELTTMGGGTFANTFGVSGVTHCVAVIQNLNGNTDNTIVDGTIARNLMYGYSNNLDGHGPGVVILNEVNGELVIIVGLPYINGYIMSELACYV